MKSSTAYNKKSLLLNYNDRNEETSVNEKEAHLLAHKEPICHSKVRQDHKSILTNGCKNRASQKFLCAPKAFPVT